MSSVAQIRAAKAYVELMLKSDSFFKDLRAAETRLHRFRRTLEEASKTGIQTRGLDTMLRKLDALQAKAAVLASRFRQVGTAANGIGNSLAGAAFALGFAGAPAVSGLVEFQRQMNTVFAITRATKEEMAGFERQARDIAKSSQFSPQDVGSAQVALARGGLRAGSLSAALPTVIDFATANQVTPKAAADFFINLKAQFKFEDKEFQDVADIYTKVVNDSAQTIEDIIAANPYTGTLTAQAGLGVKDFAAIQRFLGDAGVKGSTQGTSIDRLIKNAADPDKIAKLNSVLQAAGEAGVSVQDQEGNFRSVLEIMIDLNKQAKELNTYQNIAGQSDAFGRAAKASLNLSTIGEELRNYRDELSNAGGTTKEVASIIDSRGYGSFIRLKSAIQDMFLAFGESLSLNRFLDELQAMVVGITRVVQANDKLLSKLVPLFTAVVLGAIAFKTAGFFVLTWANALTIAAQGANVLGKVLTFLAPAITAVSNAAFAAVAGFLRLTKLGAVFSAVASFIASGPIGWIVGALALIGATLIALSPTVREMLSNMFRPLFELGAKVGEAMGVAVQALLAGDLPGAWAIVVASMQLVWASAMEYFTKNYGLLIDIWNGTMKGLANVWEVFTMFVTDSWNLVAGIFGEVLGFIDSIFGKWVERAVNVFDGMFRDWAGFVASFKKLWETFTYFISDMLLISMENGAKAFEFLLRTLSFGLLDLEAKFSSTIKGIRDIAESDYNDRIKAINAEAEAKRKANGDEAKRREEAASEERKNAADRLNELLELQKRKREEAKKANEFNAPDAEKGKIGLDGTATGDSNGLAGGDTGVSGSDTKKRVEEAFGAFNNAAVVRLAKPGSGDKVKKAMEKVAKEAEAIADNTEALYQEAKRQTLLLDAIGKIDE